jgi:hypothetical protein
VEGKYPVDSPQESAVGNAKRLAIGGTKIDFYATVSFLTLGDAPSAASQFFVAPQPRPVYPTWVPEFAVAIRRKEETGGASKIVGYLRTRFAKHPFSDQLVPRRGTREILAGVRVKLATRLERQTDA